MGVVMVFLVLVFLRLKFLIVCFELCDSSLFELLGIFWALVDHVWEKLKGGKKRNKNRTRTQNPTKSKKEGGGEFFFFFLGVTSF